MPRRRASAPSPLVLRPSNVPLRRGQPKFTLPSPPSTQALHIVDSDRSSRAEEKARHHVQKCSRKRGDSVALKEMPRLEELGELLKQAVEGGVGFAAGAKRDEKDGRIEEDREENGQTTGSSTGSVAERMGLGVKPWSGKDAVLPQIAIW